MGENAFRKSDGVNVKIGTCENMYYIRYEDRFKVSKAPNSLNPATTTDLRWRLPFPDEDNVSIGNYENHKRGFRLYGVSEVQGAGDIDANGLDIPDDDPGVIQLRHDSGLLVNVPCHHGRKLPDSGPEIKVFWNGKSWSLELVFIKNTPEGVKPIVGCRHCGQMWRFDWSEVMPYIHGEMKSRLIEYAQAEESAKAATV